MTTEATTTTNTKPERLHIGLQIAFTVAACFLSIATGAACWYGATAQYLTKENAKLAAHNALLQRDLTLVQTAWESGSRVYSWDQLPSDGRAVEVRQVTSYSVEGMGGEMALVADSQPSGYDAFYLVSVPLDMHLKSGDHCWPAHNTCQPSEMY